MDGCGIYGVMYTDDTLRGIVGSESSIHGKLQTQGILVGSLGKESTIQGKLQTEGSLAGAVGGRSSIEGNVETMGFLVGDVGFPSCAYPRSYEGDYEVTPKVYAQMLDTDRKYMREDVTVKAIPYYETSNESGTTVYIADEL